MAKDYPGQCLIENFDPLKTFLSIKDSGFTIKSPMVKYNEEKRLSAKLSPVFGHFFADGHKIKYFKK